MKYDLNRRTYVFIDRREIFCELSDTKKDGTKPTLSSFVKIGILKLLSTHGYRPSMLVVNVNFAYRLHRSRRVEIISVRCSLSHRQSSGTTKLQHALVFVTKRQTTTRRQSRKLEHVELTH